MYSPRALILGNGEFDVMLLENPEQMALLVRTLSNVTYDTVVFKLNFVDLSFAIQQTLTEFDPSMNVVRLRCEGAFEFVQQCVSVVQ